MSTEVRELGRDDLAAAWPIWLATGWNGDQERDGYGIDEAAFTRSWAGSILRLGVFEADRLLAIGRANGDGVLYAMIHDVVVHPAHRGQGLGRMIVAALVERLRTRDIRVIQLMAAADQAPFYESLGFQQRPADRPGMAYVG